MRPERVQEKATALLTDFRIAACTRRGAVVAFLTLVLALGLVACSSDDATEKEELPETLQSAPEDPFEVVEHEGKSYVVGHKLVLDALDSWHIYDPESQTMDGTTWEWAIGEPEGKPAVPAYISFSAAIPGGGATTLENGLRTAATKIASVEKDYALIDEGATDVAGAKTAEFIRFTRSIDYMNKNLSVEQVSLFVEVEPGVTSTLRFFAPAGEWDDNWKKIYDSVRVSR